MLGKVQNRMKLDNASKVTEILKEAEWGTRTLKVLFEDLKVSGFEGMLKVGMKVWSY